RREFRRASPGAACLQAAVDPAFQSGTGSYLLEDREIEVTQLRGEVARGEARRVDRAAHACTAAGARAALHAHVAVDLERGEGPGHLHGSDEQPLHRQIAWKQCLDELDVQRRCTQIDLREVERVTEYDAEGAGQVRTGREHARILREEEHALGLHGMDADPALTAALLREIGVHPAQVAEAHLVGIDADVHIESIATGDHAADHRPAGFGQLECRHLEGNHAVAHDDPAAQRLELQRLTPDDAVHREIPDLDEASRLDGRLPHDAVEPRLDVPEGHHPREPARHLLPGHTQRIPWRLQLDRHADDCQSVDDAGILEEDEGAARRLLPGGRVGEDVLEVPGGVTRQLLDVDLGAEQHDILEHDVAADERAPIVLDGRGVDADERAPGRIDDGDVVQHRAAQQPAAAEPTHVHLALDALLEPAQPEQPDALHPPLGARHDGHDRKHENGTGKNADTDPTCEARTPFHFSSTLPGTSSERLSDREMQLQSIEERIVRVPADRRKAHEPTAVLEQLRRVVDARLDRLTPVPQADLGGEYVECLCATTVIADIDADGSDRAEVPEPDARRDHETHRANVAAAGPDLARVDERSAAELLPPDRKAELDVRLEQRPAPGRP